MAAEPVRLPAALVETIDACAAMIDAAAIRQTSMMAPRSEPLPSLLEQCRRLTDRISPDPEPIRTIHHFACTGGTLISRCLACMPNTQLLSEVEPFSRTPAASLKGSFHPTDLIQLIHHSSRGSDHALEEAIFLAGLETIYDACWRNGLRLTLRDHAHSRYCVGECVNREPHLRELVAKAYPVRSIVTVRHPLDSYLSLHKLGWRHFEPATLDEYCNRYLRFLDDYEGVQLFRYEDFVTTPSADLEAMCEALDLPFFKGFEKLYSAQRLSGDSGRSSDVIAPRERRTVPDSLAAETVDSAAYNALCGRMGYET